jgi:single-strand DNA-binding protein
MYNKVNLIGHLGNDPEIRRLEGGDVVARFSIATNENYRDKSGNWQTITDWHNVVAWRGLAERVERSLKKGSLVFVEGKLKTRKWQDKDGNDKYTTEVVAGILRFLDKREDSESSLSSGIPGGQNSFQKESSESQSSTPAPEMDDDLPF